MAWTSLKFTTGGTEAEPWAEALLAAGALSVEVTDADAGTVLEVAQFGEPGESAPGLWQTSILAALFDAAVDVPAVVAAAATAHGWRAPVVYTLTAVEEQDWVRLTQSQFEPIRISDRLWIVPSWHVPRDDTAINVIVDPGLAFGTGSHPTTRLCLLWLAAHLRPGDTVLDYGCGSGILAIAAKRLGASDVVGIDIDPQALTASRSNAAINDVECEFVEPNRLVQRGFDVVVANILTNPLRALAPALATRVHRGGAIVLSGILVEQAAEIVAVYAPWFNIGVWRTDQGWAAIAGTCR
ncbi:MAG: 50S ribosomal protein L11 methyltransferase [Betaproteobacteria bacterium]